MTRPAVVFDACVLYPAPLRDFLLQLACMGLFRAKWTTAIHEEWIRNLLQNRPDLTIQALTRTRRLMDQAIPNALIRGYESIIRRIILPDPADRHVLAAAIHPDHFIGEWIDQSPESVCESARLCRKRLKNPPMTVDDYIDCLERQGLQFTADFFRGKSESLL